MVVRISRKRMYRWRAGDHEGEVLDMLVQRRRDKRAAVRLMRKLLKQQGFTPKLLITDKLGSYGSPFRHLRLHGSLLSQWQLPNIENRCSVLEAVNFALNAGRSDVFLTIAVEATKFSDAAGERR